ncbi:CLUMA_CG008699, isoform A [Clunio marinus]|uniref:CLUMA_CG008699, isoform A n=1 Tax=Clunio marinus TaxID=568069 RepID=A0A1J1I6C1_9DIPT|nr:CLUMA_CG008699, isoform A [Clunio marinus]
MVSEHSKLINLIDKLKRNWDQCEKNSPDVFRYKLNVTNEKVLDGNFKFYVQLNKDRAIKRRKPEKFDSIIPPFNPNEFNFNKVDKREILMVEEINGSPVLFLINNSPLTKYHLLIVPDVEGNHPQVMTRQCLELAIDVMKSSNDKSIRLGYNSPGALASVNHLHIHLLSLDKELWIEFVELKNVASNLFKINDSKFPVKGFCMIAKETKSDAEKLSRIIEYCCANKVPHNMFFTKSRMSDDIRIFFYPRMLGNFGAEKVYTSLLNVAFCELSGYIPIGDENLYETINENYIIDRFNQEIQNIISDYCKNVQQSKPFSHIMMELFKRVANDPNFNQLSQKDEKHNKNRRNHLINSTSINSDGHKSDTDSGRSSDYRSDDNSLQKKLARMNEEPVKYFSLPRPKYNRKSENIPVEIPKIKYRSNAEVFRQRRVGGRRFTVDITSSEVDTALADVGQQKPLSRSISNLNKPKYDEMNFKTLPNMKLAKKESIIEEDESDRPKGPEFIVNSTAEIKTIDISDMKCASKGIVSVLLLNGRTYNISCNPLATTTQMIFEAIIKSEQIQENYILGLCALIGGDFVFLPMDLKVYKVAPQVWIQSTTKKANDEIKNSIFSLYLRVKLFLPTLRIISIESRHTLFLQLRKSILENHIVCTDDDLITLGGLALQAEVGNFQDEMKQIEYFTMSHYLPDGVYQQNKELGKYLRNSHFSKRGLHPKEAELNFIRYVQEMREYGIHYISGVWTRDDKIELNVYIGIGLNGIKIFERNVGGGNVSRNKTTRKCNKRLIYEEFDWLEIENICFSKQILCIVVRKSNLRLNLGSKEKTRLKFKIKMDSRKSFFAFTIASHHHQFYMKLRNSFVSIKSIADELNIPLVDESFIQPNVNIKIDKSSKTSGLRVRNLKKSMLNDPRLLKLKDRFIRRSKSTVCDFKRTTEETANENNQNKENERPQFPSMIDLAVKSPSVTRNKVKMGTRVFSASYLNKSFDSLSENQTEITRVDSWGALCLKAPDAFDETPEEDEKENDFLDKDKEEAYVVESSIKSININNNFSMPNETMSQSLLEKFEDISCTDDRVLSQITIVKDPVFSSDKLNFKSQSLRNLTTSNVDNLITGYSMGISIVQGNSDNYVYVKELVRNGPGDRNGICVGDQIVSVDGTSLLNLPYDEALQILQKSGKTVTLIVSQVFTRKPLKEKQSFDDGKLSFESPTKKSIISNLITTPSKSLPNLMNSKDYQLPKIVAIIPKENLVIPSQNKKTRKYIGPTKYPVTPCRKEKDLKLTISPNSHKTHLSLPTNDLDTLNI